MLFIEKHTKQNKRIHRLLFVVHNILVYSVNFTLKYSKKIPACSEEAQTDAFGLSNSKVKLQVMQEVHTENLSRNCVKN